MNEPARVAPESLAIEHVRAITDREFAQWSALVRREAGIALGPSKKALLVGRLARRLRVLGLKNFTEYYRLVTESDPQERIRALDCISTNETHFFREPRQFDFLERRVLPELRAERCSTVRRDPIRAWSAGCSTGEEPYSLAMLLLEQFPASCGVPIEIVATDLSTRALERAAEAVWPIEKAEEIPPARRKAFMLRGVGGQNGKMKAGPEIRAVVRFARVNLNDAMYDVGGPFDFIFCRNVLIYFDLATRIRVVDRLFDQLAPRGYLFLGHAETLNGVSERARSVVPTVYAHAGARPSPASGSRIDAMAAREPR